MVIIQVAGGLGNQLQQYALYRKFLSLSKEAKLDISWFSQGQKGENVTGRKLELDYFAGLPYTACTAQEKAAVVRAIVLKERRITDQFDLDERFRVG